MFEIKYNPALPYRFVRYGRMSDPRQNKRSPEQQFDTIDATLSHHSYPWRCIATYRDDGISGRYFRKRPGLQRMLRDIEARLIRIDLIAVDTLERLGRSEEIAELRRRLAVEHGVLVVAADTGFSDPTGVVGKAVGMVEQIRSTENTRISRHNVLRGKKDAARRRRWPGGPAPFGFRLKRIVDESATRAEVYQVLEIDPRAAAALRRAFERAAATGEGDQRLSRWWNTSAEIPDDYKPVSPFTMGYRLENPIAVGTLRWGAHRTGVVNDRRLIERSPDQVEWIDGFCPALVSGELYERVQTIRRLRSTRARPAGDLNIQDPPTGPKLIAPQVCGRTLKYLLSGLVRCGECGASMRPAPSGRMSRAGRRYVYYTCPRHFDGACSNGLHIPEDALRHAVVARLRARLFPLPCTGPTLWVTELGTFVRHEVCRLRSDAPDDNAAHQAEMKRLTRELDGWSLSLANPDLPAAVRRSMEVRLARGLERQQELSSLLSTKAVSSPKEVPGDAMRLISALAQLGDILGKYNPTMGNVQFGKHVDSIACYHGGRIELRGTALGVFEGASIVLRTDDASPDESGDAAVGVSITKRRKLPARATTLSTDRANECEPLAEEASRNLEIRLEIGLTWPEPTLTQHVSSWSRRLAHEVARLRAKGMTHAKLAVHFRVSVPTIRKALRHVKATCPSLLQLPGKMPRPRWPERHFAEVAALHARGLSVRRLCVHFARSEPLIRSALRLANATGEQAKLELPTDGP